MTTATPVLTKPMPFSGPMILRLLDGTKTMTRRVIKPQPVEVSMSRPGLIRLRKSDACLSTFENASPHPIGSIVWCRETYRTIHDPATCIGDALDIDYHADGTERIMDRFKTPGLVKWKSGRFMPKYLSRITLEITAVRVERLNSISNEDAIAEGIPQTWGEWGPNPPAWAEKSIGRKFGSPGTHLWDNRTSRENFALLWDEINGLGAWDRNEWVFRYRFRRIKP